MRSYQIFGSMTPERATAMMQALSENSPAMYASALTLAASAMRARPVYLRRQPFEKRAASIRRALARVSSNEIAEDILAVYFLECRKELLVEWLDLLGIEHEDGVLSEDAPAAPDAKKLEKAIAAFRKGDDPEDRELLLQAFAAQASIEWSDLDDLIAGDSQS
jgi:hypothetical protein